jgi:hypothetical protein
MESDQQPIPEARFDPSRWGGWRLVSDECLAFYAYGKNSYPHAIFLDLNGISTAHLIRQIMNVAAQPWATERVLAGLIHALDHLLNPGETLRDGAFGPKRLKPWDVRDRLRTVLGRDKARKREQRPAVFSVA